jgi:hypothetical protein
LVFKSLKISFVPSMQRLTVISLLGLLLFNAFGYYFLSGYQQEQAKHLAISQVKDADFTLIKLPASLYLHMENTDFEYVDQVFEYKNETYNKVKQRIHNDTLEIYCVHNVQHEKLKANFNDYVSGQLDVDNNDSPKDSPLKHLLKNFLKEYITDSPLKIAQIASNTEGGYAVENLPSQVYFPTPVFMGIVSPPPDRA